VYPRTEPLFSQQKNAQKTRLEEEGEEALHPERLSNHAACLVAEFSPVGAELELEWNARDHTNGKACPEYAKPKTSCLIVLFVSRAMRSELQYKNEQNQTHGQLGEQIVKRRGKAKLQSVPKERVAHP
jgi:hypothetical protein